MPTQESSGTLELLRRIDRLDGRDLQLWSITALVILVLAAGVLALLYPEVVWHLGTVEIEGRYLPQLFFGFISLILLFNIYALQKRHSLRMARAELLRELIRRQSAEQQAVLDPLTEVFNRRYMDEVLKREINRANRLNSPITLLMIDVDGFKGVNTRLGHLRGDQLLCEVAHVLKRNFRTSDTVIRYGGDEFLVVMPDTDEQQAVPAVKRLLAHVERWNAEHPDDDYTMSLSCGTSTYVKGGNLESVLAAADQNMYAHKERHKTSVRR